MNYIEYLHVQSQIERMHDFHPEFFDMLSEEEKNALHEGFLYDVPDDTYPESIKAFYDEKVAKNLTLQRQMLRAAQRIYTLSNSGSIEDSMKNNISFKNEDNTT